MKGKEKKKEQSEDRAAAVPAGLGGHGLGEDAHGGKEAGAAAAGGAQEESGPTKRARTAHAADGALAGDDAAGRGAAAPITLSEHLRELSLPALTQSINFTVPGSQKPRTVPFACFANAGLRLLSHADSIDQFVATLLAVPTSHAKHATAAAYGRVLVRICT